MRVFMLHEEEVALRSKQGIPPCRPLVGDAVGPCAMGGLIPMARRAQVTDPGPGWGSSSNLLDGRRLESSSRVAEVNHMALWTVRASTWNLDVAGPVDEFLDVEPPDLQRLLSRLALGLPLNKGVELVLGLTSASCHGRTPAVA